MTPSLDTPPLLIHAGPLNEWGEPMESTRARFERAAHRYHQGLNERIILTADTCYVGRAEADGWEEMLHHQDGLPFTDYMAYWLHLKGVREGDILKSRPPKETVGEWWFARNEILDRHGITEVDAITNDFHRERCEAIADLILGPGYKINYFTVNTSMDSPKHANRIREREAKSLDMFLEQFGDVRPGDGPEIEKRLYTVHGLYKNISPEERTVFYHRAEEL